MGRPATPGTETIADGEDVDSRTDLLEALLAALRSGDLAALQSIAAEAVETVKGCKPQRCTLTNFSASSLDYQLVMEMKSVDPDRMARDRAAVMLALIERFAAEKIAFAYPVQIAYTAAPDGSLVMPYAEE